MIFSDELLYTSGSAGRAFLGALKAQKSPKMIPTSFKVGFYRAFWSKFTHLCVAVLMVLDGRFSSNLF